MIAVANATNDEWILMTDELRIIKSEQNINVFLQWTRFYFAVNEQYIVRSEMQTIRFAVV